MELYRIYLQKHCSDIIKMLKSQLVVSDACFKEAPQNPMSSNRSIPPQAVCRSFTRPVAADGDGSMKTNTSPQEEENSNQEAPTRQRNT